ncbi:MAG: METTL5 family protein [Nitrososphaerota archaeon]|jgi:putative methylase|nr:METTL5 family protein [Nitrososphaerota archaeon]
MDRYAQKRIIRKLDLELFVASLQPQPNPQVHLEQYTTPEDIVANLLYIAAYTRDDILGRSVLDLGCGTGRLGLGAAFLGAAEVVGVDIDPVAIKVAQRNTQKTALSDCVHWVNGDIAAVQGRFDTVVQNPPFGVQRRCADQAFLIKALEVAHRVYSIHNHPQVDASLLRLLKASGGVIQVLPSPFLVGFITKCGGGVTAVYSMLMTIPKMFTFHQKLKHTFVIDLYIIEKQTM